MAAKKKKAQGNATSANGKADVPSRLPFEPTPTRQTPKQSSGTAKSKVAPSPAAQTLAAPSPAAPSKAAFKGASNSSAIPEVVNRRMVSRAALFCGVPTVFALLTFVVSYFAIANDVFHPPTAAVLLVSLGFFGLGVLGLSYGPLSASWDEERVGNLFGLDEFKLNFGRLRASWRAAKAAKD